MYHPRIVHSCNVLEVAPSKWLISKALISLLFYFRAVFLTYTIKEEYYPMGGYKDKYIQWTMLQQQRDQDVHELTNIFHTLCTKLGIKDSEKHLVLKYRSCMHIYI